MVSPEMIPMTIFWEGVRIDIFSSNFYDLGSLPTMYNSSPIPTIFLFLILLQTTNMVPQLSDGSRKPLPRLPPKMTYENEIDFLYYILARLVLFL